MIDVQSADGWLGQSLLRQKLELRTGILEQLFLLHHQARWKLKKSDICTRIWSKRSERIESRCERKMFFWHKMILGDISVLENVVSCEMCTVLNKVWMKCKKAKCIFHIPNLFSLSSKPPTVGNFLNRKKLFFRIELVMASHC